ncbi:MAG: nitric oxide reductase activation protein NorD [Halomonas sp.]
MTQVRLEDYRATIEAADAQRTEALRHSLEANFQQVARMLSPRGQAHYLDGARALATLGRGGEPVLAYLEAMPEVARELGEDILPEVQQAAMRLSSMVSGQVVTLMLSSLPLVARRLGDPDLMRQFLELVHQLASRAPRGLRPMLEHIDELFTKLTLGGFRRWALQGAQAYGSDFEQQRAYFALESSESQATLQQERRGTLFIDSQRQLNFYLRALWGQGFFLRPTSGDFDTAEGYRPFIGEGVIYLPDAYDDYRGLPGKHLYRAAAAHAAAHRVYSGEPLSPEGLNAAQMAVIGLLEDARVEQRALQDFPGLRQLWQAVHECRREERSELVGPDPVVERLERAALALLDPACSDDDPWVQAAQAHFHERFPEEGGSAQLAYRLGIELYSQLAERFPMPSARVLERSGAPYRDDNRFLFTPDDPAWQGLDASETPAEEGPTRRYVSVMEMVNEIDSELDHDDYDAVWVLQSELFPYEDHGISYNQMEGVEPVSPPFHYAEWDYQVQLERPAWVTLIERRPARGEPEAIDAVLTEHRPIANRLRYLVDALQPQGMIRERGQEDGDELDIDAAVRAMVDQRLGMTPDPRINIRHTHKTRDLAVLLLLDLSESTNDPVDGGDKTILQLTREAATLLAWAVNGIGDPFAIHGFSSDGRHDVRYYRFKDFGQPWDGEAKSRLAGMRGEYSTRMGAALRHAGQHLRRRPERRKLLLVVTDGEPHDIDVRDPQHLRQDAKKAVDDLAAHGVTPYCLTLDPYADDYVSRIFGPNGYAIVDRVERLPERLPAVFAQLTR